MKVRREGAPGHFDEAYRQDLLQSHVRQHRDAERDVGFLAKRTSDEELAERLGEEFVRAATSGAPAALGSADAVVAEEVGGPFVETTERQEFARGLDASNPADAEPAAFPLGRDPAALKVDPPRLASEDEDA